MSARLCPEEDETMIKINIYRHRTEETHEA